MNQEIIAKNNAATQPVANKKSTIQSLVLLGGIILLIVLGIIISYYFIFYSSPQRILNKAIGNMGEIKSLRFKEIATETETGGEISKVSGDIIFPDKLKINLIPEVKDLENIIIDGKVYTGWLGEWNLIEGKKSEEFNIYNPQKFIELLSFASKIKSLEKEKLGEQNIIHLEYAIDKNEAKKTFSQEDNISYKGGVWIGEREKLIYKTSITFIPENQDEAPIKYQMEFSNFNGNIRIEEPKL